MEIDQNLTLKHDNLFDIIVLYTATGLFALTMVFTIIQVFIRILDISIFGSLYWTEPAARLVLILGTFFGAAVATRNQEHIKIAFILDRITKGRPRLGQISDTCVTIAVVAFLVIAILGTMGMAAIHWNTSISGLTVASAGMVYLGISIGLGLMLVYELLNLVKHLRESIENEYQQSTDIEGR